MISSVVLTGYVDEMVGDKYRLIKTEHTDALGKDRTKVSYIPVMYWTREAINPIFASPKGCFVVIRGHIERSSQDGLYIVAETIQLSK